MGSLFPFLLLAAPLQDEPVAPKERLALFNGKDLSGFTRWLADSKGDDPRGVYTVVDGMIRISGDGFGYLSTDKAYRDYRVVVEFKWGAKNWRGREGKARDSGLFLHSAGPDGNSYDGGGAYKAAIECNIMEGATGDFLLINGKGVDGRRIPVRAAAEAAPERDREGWPTWKRGGSRVTLDRGGRIGWSGRDADWKDVFGFRGRDDVESPAGEWTRVECACDGTKITVSVNGRLVNEAVDVEPSGGKLLLQCEGSEVFFRRFELHPLKEKG